mmetsp:Transcript_10051/g.26714  ORF Transcript_10051/g.26714 Transcript_10051/m.26714 type:complete len:293 (-) Transcript_10051:138-1016(-)
MPLSGLRPCWRKLLVAASVAWLLPHSGWAQDDMDDVDGMDAMGGMDGLGGSYDDEDMPTDGEGGEDGGGGAGSDIAAGAISLDNYTFDKVLSLPGQVVLVKFDQSYPYGEKQEEFEKLSKHVYSVPNFFVADVQVAEYGDKQNDDLRLRFDLKREDFPVYILFKGIDDRTTYSGKVTASDISSWLRRKGLKVAAIGTIAELDDIVAKFMRGGLADAEIEAAQELAETTFKDDAKAPLYVKIMKKIKEKGEGYLATETARLEKIMAGQVADHKRTELADKTRILTVLSSRDEL